MSYKNENFHIIRGRIEIAYSNLLENCVKPSFTFSISFSIKAMKQLLSREIQNALTLSKREKNKVNTQFQKEKENKSLKYN